MTSYRLSRGAHRADGKRYCALELLCLAAGQEWSDHPDGVDPTLALAVRILNDSITSRRVRTALLLPYVLRDPTDHGAGPGVLLGTDDARNAARVRLLHRTFGPRWVAWLGRFATSASYSTADRALLEDLLRQLVDPRDPGRRAPAARVPAQAGARTVYWPPVR